MIAYRVSQKEDFSIDKFSPSDWALGVCFESEEPHSRCLESGGHVYKFNLAPKNLQEFERLPSRSKTEKCKAQGCDAISFPSTESSSGIYQTTKYLVFNPDIVTYADCQSSQELLRESLVVHSRLNSKLFDEEAHLKEDVRDRLMEIGDEFVTSLKEDGVPLKVCDYWLVGSNAAYNYQPDSDVDLHIIVNMEDLDVDEKILRLLYDYIKSSWSQKYDITIKGHPLEMYLEDSRTSSASNGIYSIKKDKWIKVPEPQEDKKLYPEDSDLYRDWLSRYNNLEDEEVEQFIDDLYLMRKEALASEGEFALGNLIFKEFRNSGRLDILRDRKNEIKSRELTLESLSRDCSES